VEGRLIQSAGLGDGVLRRDPRALARLGALVRGQILDGSVVRVKLWSAAGTVLYSDEPALIGKRFSLAADERRILREGRGADAELSDLSKPENRYERHEGKLLEAHTVVHTPNGTPVLFEIYQRFGSVSASAERQLRALAPPLLGGLLVLLLFQVPLAWTMARRLQRGHREREALLASAIESSGQERGRIAAGLHDGVVQDLAGIAFGLAPLAEEADRRGAPQAASELREATSRLRQGVRDLRSLLVDIHPPSLETAGLEAALSDLLSPLAAAGVNTELHVEEGTPDGSGEDALVYRVAREAVRNAQSHAGAATVRIELTRPDPGMIRMVIEDDGRGFEADERERRATEGHVGLSLLEDLVRQAGGRLSVRSVQGGGTTVELELAAR
jgi:signal transduction histidine kinase